jgi:hypothetical protein
MCRRRFDYRPYCATVHAIPPVSTGAARALLDG